MGMPVWINCRGVVIDDENGRPGYLIGCLNETGKPQRADNVSGLLGGLEFCSYLRSQAKPITHGFLMHIGIDNFGAINGASGSLYGDYILKSVADCMTECLSGGQRLYHLVADQYVIADLESHTKEDAVQLRKRICDRIEDFIVAEKYETVIRRNIGNTRARDFYDLFVLVKIKKDEIRWNVLKEAVQATAIKRDSLEELTEYKEIIEDMQESQFLERIWEKYKEENTYSEGIAFADTLDIVSWIGRELEKY